MKRSFWLAFFGIAISLCAMTTAAQAQATRTWVSGVGDDANPCSRTAPCKTFAGAISKTAAGGEIDALDPGGFGTLTITKAITIDGGGGQVASVLASGTIGFNINAGANDSVTLRNLRINGAGTTLGTKGINVINVGTLHVQDVVIENFSNVGIDAENSAIAFIDVVDSIIQNNTVGGIFSSTAATGGGRNRISIKNTSFMGNGYGVRASLNTRVAMTRSFIGSGIANACQGVLADAASSAVDLASTMISNLSGTGVHASNSAIIHISDMLVVHNVNGLVFDSAGQIISWGNNHITDNPSGDGAPSSTVAPT